MTLPPSNTKKSVHVRIQTTPSIIYFRSIIYADCSHILAQYFGFISSLLFIQHIFILQQHIHIMIFSPYYLFLYHTVPIWYLSRFILLLRLINAIYIDFNIHSLQQLHFHNDLCPFFTFYSELRHNLVTSEWYSIDINEKETTRFSFINLFHKLSSF